MVPEAAWLEGWRLGADMGVESKCYRSGVIFVEGWLSSNR